MQKIAESQRLYYLEEKWKHPIKELFRKWHWQDNLKHREIADRIRVPRPTVTRWFKAFGIPSQTGARFTNLNLLNVGPTRTPPAQPKIVKPRPWKVNYEFFNKWSSEMAYILGFFCADGCMYINPRGSHYISFNITDKDLLIKIKEYLGTGHKLSLKSTGNKNWKASWSIQIGSKYIFHRFIRLGITPQKSRRMVMPPIPKKYINDFVRGYFDGDGGVWYGFSHKNDRRNPTRVLVTSFTSCSEGLLKDIATALYKFGGTRLKQTTFHSGAFRLYYSTSDSRRIYAVLYRNNPTLYLARKKIIFEKYLGP